MLPTSLFCEELVPIAFPFRLLVVVIVVMIIVIMMAVAIAHHVIHGLFISAAKSFPVILTGTPLDMRVAVLIAIIYIGPAMFVVVFARALDSVVIALALNFAELAGRSVPSTLFLRVRGRRSCQRSLGMTV